MNQLIKKALFSFTILSAGFVYSSAPTDWGTAVSAAVILIGDSSTSNSMLWDIATMRNFIGTQANSDASFRGMVCALRAIRLRITNNPVVSGTTDPLLHNCFVDLDFFTNYFFTVSSNNIPQYYSSQWKANCAKLKGYFAKFI